MSEHDFCRLLLKVTMEEEVRKCTTVAQRKAAWTYTYDGGTGEFHGPNKYYWHGVACCKWAARTNGWNAWILQQRAELFTRKLETPEDCERWIRDLEAANLAFHFDDDPTTLINNVDGERTFTDEEADAIRSRVGILFDLLSDPFETLIDAME